MKPSAVFAALDARERFIFDRLNRPWKIQDYLESLAINFEEDGETCLSPRSVLKQRKAHCMEGAVFAAAVLYYHGQKPLLVDLQTARGDYDHAVAVFNVKGYWGAISKTNHAVLRYREPVYKTIRELVLSYFHEYFLDDGRKTLRKYSEPFDLRIFNKDQWVTSSADLWQIDQALYAAPHLALLPPHATVIMRRADPIEIEAGKLKAWREEK